MAELTKELIRGYSCDIRSCSAEFSGDYLEGRSGRRVHADHAALAGWSCYVGRSVRHYCPDHRPSPGHTMELLWGGFGG